MLKVVVAGSRGFNDYSLLHDKLMAILKDVDRPIIISGGAKGADKLGERFADDNDLEKIICPACWDGFGKGAGVIRNRLMASIADACICFWDGESNGTASMIREAKKQDLKFRVINITE